ncbi:protocadherin beta-16-like isoform X2 [Denticeps clupeoides]|uniref:Cadherin domain-containing protein n=1 Tax=Denticeps clupeoides TaxID=299321 RepID=A0AAY4BDC0_9TELE|nr:protocadherin beta-16-like isoform X2 [Denticeps clupeoides]
MGLFFICLSVTRLFTRMFASFRSQRLIHIFRRTEILEAGLQWRALVIFMLCYCRGASAQIRYSIPEEMKKGSLIGNIAHDLGLDVTRLQSGRARVLTEDGHRFAELRADKGILVASERIDREQICGDVTPCSFTFELIFESPMELHHVTVEILDINDHAPFFQNNRVSLEISESAALGSRFMLGSAEDPDVGSNALQNYLLTPNENFALSKQAHGNGVTSAEMVLQKPLDRELRPRLALTLTAVDGGNPPRSGTVNIEVIVLDVNDNAPVFNQSVYKASVLESAQRGTYITTINASDADSGTNRLITYSFANLKGNVADVFSLNGSTGVITVNGQLDFEKAAKYELDLQAKDQGGLGDSSKLVVELIDVNDNVPSINVMSFSSPVSEDAPLGATIAIINVKDVDSAENGNVVLTVNRTLPFKLTSSLRNYYTLVTDAFLDRELVAQYNITITATDSGSPPFSSTRTLKLDVSDVNDNAPVFDQTSYTAHVLENNSPGLSIFTVSARDSDVKQNAQISYFLEEASRVSSYVSVNAESGVVYAARSFDYEQTKHVTIRVKAQDGGSPPMSSNVTVHIIIQDQNDNAPQILYPVESGGSLVAEMVPRAADVGYLVTKVVAVDVDSGQNAWLSYKLQKATDRALFEVGAQNGEIRTARQVTDKDPVKQKLTVVVEDNGQPSRSATVNVNVAVADSFPEVLSEFTDFTHEKEKNENLTFYLVLALAAVSFLFICCLVVIISVKIYRWRQSRLFCQSNLPVIPYYPPHYADAGGAGTLQRVYNYDLCMTTDSRRSDCKIVTPGSQGVLIMDTNCVETIQRKQKDPFLLDAPESPSQQKPPSNDWRLPPNQRPGPSGQYRFHTIQQRWTPYEKSRAVAHPEGAPAVTGTGPWPNPPTEAEQLQALMAAANVSEATATLGPRYNAQYVPDYRQNVYIPGSTATLTTNPQQPPQQALPPPQALPPADAPKAAQTPASKKKSAKKDKK